MLARFDHHPMLTAILALTTAVLAVVVVTLATLLYTSATVASPTIGSARGANSGAVAVPANVDAAGVYRATRAGSDAGNAGKAAPPNEGVQLYGR